MTTFLLFAAVVWACLTVPVALFIGALIRHGDDAIAQAEPEPVELYVPRSWLA